MINKELGELAQDMAATLERVPGYHLAITDRRILMVVKELERLYAKQKTLVPEGEALALLRELNDALVIPERFQSRVDAVLDRSETFAAGENK